MNGEQVILINIDGSVIELPIDKLGEADQKSIKESGVMENPFAGPVGDPQSPDSTTLPSAPQVGKRGEFKAGTSDAVEIGNEIHGLVADSGSHRSFFCSAANQAAHDSQFVDNEHLISCNKSGTIAFRDFRFAKLVWDFRNGA